MKGKTICKTLGLVLLALLILVVLYVVYVFASYHRVGDQSLSVMHCSSRDAVPMEDAVETGAVYRVSSANAGFGAYSAAYSFFMDGGEHARAADGAQIDAAVAHDGVLHRLRAFALADHAAQAEIEQARRVWIHPARSGRPARADNSARGRLRRPGVVNDCVAQ